MNIDSTTAISALDGRYRGKLEALAPFVSELGLIRYRVQVESARVALGAVAPTVVVVPKAARAITGTKLDDKALEKLAAACEAACSPISDKRGTVEYRTEVAGVLARRAAKIAYDRARGKR